MLEWKKMRKKNWSEVLQGLQLSSSSLSNTGLLYGFLTACKLSPTLRALWGFFYIVKEDFWWYLSCNSEIGLKGKKYVWNYSTATKFQVMSSCPFSRSPWYQNMEWIVFFSLFLKLVLWKFYTIHFALIHPILKWEGGLSEFPCYMQE